MDDTASTWNPCIMCGACCASFRVSFYWREAEPTDHERPVPKALCEELGGNFRCMKGTNAKHKPQCAALKGRIGKTVACTIYENRPTTCREFSASFEEGKHNPKCDEARLRHGLRPLTREDWLLATKRAPMAARAPRDLVDET